MVKIPSYFWVVISEWRRKRYEKKTVRHSCNAGSLNLVCSFLAMAALNTQSPAISNIRITCAWGSTIREPAVPHVYYRCTTLPLALQPQHCSCLAPAIPEPPPAREEGGMYTLCPRVTRECVGAMRHVCGVRTTPSLTGHGRLTSSRSSIWRFAALPGLLPPRRRLRRFKLPPPPPLPSPPLPPRSPTAE